MPQPLSLTVSMTYSPGRAPGVTSAVGVVAQHVSRLDGELARARDGVAGVDGEVCQHLVDL